MREMEIAKKREEKEAQAASEIPAAAPTRRRNRTNWKQTAASGKARDRDNVKIHNFPDKAEKMVDQGVGNTIEIDSAHENQRRERRAGAEQDGRLDHFKKRAPAPFADQDCKIS